MKDKIDSILLNIYEQVQDGIKWDKAAEELTELMCYREAKAFIAALEEEIWLPDLIPYLEAQGYDGETIWAAVQEIKKETT